MNQQRFWTGTVSTVAVVFIGATLSPGDARAASSYPDVTVTATLSSLPSNASVNLMDLGTSAKSGFITNDALQFGDGNSINFTGSAGVYQSGVYHGSVTGVAAAPWTYSGADKSNYLAAEPGGNVIFNYASQQKYFGLNWGSVDSYNTLSFYNGNQIVESVTGAQIKSNANGSQNADGSDIVNFNFTNGASFNKVVFTDNSNPAFEFDTIAYSQQNIPLTTGGGSGPTLVSVVDPTHPTLLGTVVTDSRQAGAPAPVSPALATPAGAMLLTVGWGWRRRRRASV